MACLNEFSGPKYNNKWFLAGPLAGGLKISGALENGDTEKNTMADIDKIVEDLSGMTVLEVADLVKALEEKWDVSAAAPVAAMPMAGDGGGEAAEEQTEFDVVLTGFGGNKIAVIKEVRALVSGLGLADAKKLVESAPQSLAESIGKEEAEEMKKKLEAAGATVEIK